MRIPRLALLALTIAATESFAQTTAASPSTDHSKPRVWLCRPDRPGACDVDVSTTVLVPDGRSSIERARLDPKAPVDCFYVYPTVSTDTTTLSDSALGGGEAALDGYFDAKGETALPMGPADPWTVGGRPIPTPVVRVVRLLKGQCRSNAFASYLEVSVERGPDSPANRDIQGDLVEPLGLYLADMEVAMGNLVDLVGQQTKSYPESASRR